MAHTNQYIPDTVSHPGETLREKLEELDMGPKEFAVRTGKPEKTISLILNGESAVTPDMAVLFETVLKIPARFWMRRQDLYNENQARLKRETAIKKAIPWAKSFPYAKKFNTHPSMIIGRLQKREVIHYSDGNDLIVKIDLSEAE